MKPRIQNIRNAFRALHTNWLSAHHRSDMNETMDALAEALNIDPLTTQPKLPELPENAVLLGRGGSFRVPDNGFIGWAMQPEAWNPNDEDEDWGDLDERDEWMGADPDLFYAAPKDSEVVKLNTANAEALGIANGAHDSTSTEAESP